MQKACYYFKNSIDWKYVIFCGELSLLYSKDVAERDDVHFIDKDNGEMSMDSD